MRIQQLIISVREITKHLHKRLLVYSNPGHLFVITVDTTYYENKKVENNN